MNFITSSSHDNMECKMLKYSIFLKQKVDFKMVPAVKSVENTDHALHQHVLRMIGRSTEKKKFVGIPDSLFLTGLNNEVRAPLFSSVQDLYDSQYA